MCVNHLDLVPFARTSARWQVSILNLCQTLQIIKRGTQVLRATQIKMGEGALRRLERTFCLT